MGREYLYIRDHAVRRYGQRVHKGRSKLKKTDIEARIRQMFKKSDPVALAQKSGTVLECVLHDQRRFYIIYVNDTIITIVTEEMFKENVKAGKYTLIGEPEPRS